MKTSKRCKSKTMQNITIYRLFCGKYHVIAYVFGMLPASLTVISVALLNAKD